MSTVIHKAKIVRLAKKFPDYQDDSANSKIVITAGMAVAVRPNYCRYDDLAESCRIVNQEKIYRGKKLLDDIVLGGRNGQLEM